MHIDKLIEISRSIPTARRIRYVLLGRDNLHALEKSLAPLRDVKDSPIFSDELPTAMGHKIIPVDLDDFSEIVYEDQIKTSDELPLSSRQRHATIDG